MTCTTTPKNEVVQGGANRPSGGCTTTPAPYGGGGG